jgi:hypothetical protein
MAATYTVGQVLPNGNTVITDTFTTLADGTTVEQMTSANEALGKKPSGAWVSTNSETIMITGAGTPAANQQTILANILTRQTQIQAWIAANPSGAVLTAAQTLTLAEMLNGLCKLLLQQFSSTTGT